MYKLATFSLDKKTFNWWIAYKISFHLLPNNNTSANC